MYIGLAHNAGVPNIPANWTQLTTYRILVFLFDVRSYSIVCISKPLDLTPLYPKIGLQKHSYVRVHFGTMISHADRDWLLSVDLMDSIPIFVKVRGMTEWIDFSAARPFCMIRYVEELQRWTAQTYSGLNIVQSFVNTIKAHHLLRRSGATYETSIKAIQSQLPLRWLEL